MAEKNLGQEDKISPYEFGVRMSEQKSVIG